MAGQASQDLLTQTVDLFAARVDEYASGIAQRLGKPLSGTELSNQQAVQFWNYSPKYGSTQAADQAYWANIARGMTPGQALDDAYPARKLLFQQGSSISDHIDAAEKLRDQAAKQTGQAPPPQQPPMSPLQAILQQQQQPVAAPAPPPAPPMPAPVPQGLGGVPGPVAQPGAPPPGAMPQGPPGVPPITGMS